MDSSQLSQTQNSGRQRSSSVEHEYRRTSKDVPAAVAELKIREELYLKTRPCGVSHARKPVEISEHLLSVDEFATEYPKSRINVQNPHASMGLSSSTAESRLKSYGENMLKPPRQELAIVKFLRQLLGFFNLLLTFGGVLCLVAFFIDVGTAESEHKSLSPENLFLAFMLFAVSLFSAFFTYAQEAKAGKIMQGFRSLIPTKCMVIRDGNSTEIDARYLVPGDVVEIVGGQKIPADIRVLTSKDLKVNNSSITGESEPQKRSPECSHNNALETKNLMFFGSYCTNGRGLGVVIRTADRTIIGSIAKLTTSTKQEATPLHRDVQHFISMIFVFALSVGLVFFVVGFFLGYSVVQNVVFTIGVIVANVPEGLLPTITLALTLTAQRMAKKNILVKNLETVEILGSTTTICSDKTGTLTQNRMTVSHVYYDSSSYKCATVPTEKDHFSKEDATFQELHQIASLCNSTKFEDSEENMALPIAKRVTIGDASETALLKFCHPIKDVMEMRSNCPLLGSIPFNSKNKWQLHIHELPDKSKVLLMKGAPERIIGSCSNVLLHQEVEPLNDKRRETLNKAILSLGKLGERVLGFAKLDITSEFEDLAKIGDKDDTLLDMEALQEKGILPRKDMTFVGLMSMIDPPRAGVVEAVSKCHTAGIQVVMVTGDHKVTAVAIARQVGIVKGLLREELAEQKGVDASSVDDSECEAAAVSGEEMDSLQKEDWDNLLSKKSLVFARTSPQQKLTIVEKFQETGAVVAVTGDGVNDSPALKKANIGISMGSGSDVSKEAADMILMDDNFASIVNGIEEGRLIFDNLRKSIAYTLSHITPEFAQTILFVLVGIPLPLGTVMILAIDLGTEMLPALSYAVEGPEADILNRPPRKQSDRLVSVKTMGFGYFTMGMLETVACMFAYYVVMASNGFTPGMLWDLARDSFHGSGSVATPNMFGRLIGATEQKQILRKAQTAYFVGILICQLLANVFACKTRVLSLFQHGITNNLFMLGSIIFSFALGLFLIYCPGVQDVFALVPLEFKYYLPTIPFAILLLCMDEMKKFMIRGIPGGWMERYTVW